MAQLKLLALLERKFFSTAKLSALYQSITSKWERNTQISEHGLLKLEKKSLKNMIIDL